MHDNRANRDLEHERGEADHPTGAVGGGGERSKLVFRRPHDGLTDAVLCQNPNDLEGRDGNRGDAEIVGNKPAGENDRCDQPCEAVCKFGQPIPADIAHEPVGKKRAHTGRKPQ